MKKYKFIGDEENSMEHYWDGTPIKFGDIRELELTTPLKTAIKYKYFEEIENE